MKITDIRLRRFRVEKVIGDIEPAWSPGDKVQFAIGGGAVVEIVTDEGLVGYGPEVDSRFFPRLHEILVGRDPLEVEALNNLLGYAFPSGSHYQYISGVDVALWDIVGKAKGLPLYKLWGGQSDTVVPYASLARLSTPEERAEMAASFKDQNWRAIKLRLHHEKFEDDIRTVEKVREAVGDDVDILVDANQAQSAEGWQPGVRWDYERALDTAQALQALQCGWLEEPLPRYAYDDLAKLTNAVDLPIAGGENNGLVRDFEEMCEKGAYNILQPEVLVLNGITALRKVGDIAEKYGKGLAPHNGYGKLGMIAHLHLIASWKNAKYLEIVHEPPVGDYRHFLSVLKNPPQVDRDGLVRIPDRPGLGVDINEALLET